jgi:spore coat polysaccharide biosynthesis protein SpsF
MTDSYRTEQEAFWAGPFGNAYIDRNRDAALLASRTSMFARMLARAGTIGSVVEFGANIGLNMLALRHLLPEAELSAIEINPEAVKALRTQEGLTVHHGSILDPQVSEPHDLAFTSGVLIHIDPDELPRVYDNMYAASSRYVALSEYYNPTPVAIPYRGHEDRLFKRDFAGDLLDRFPDLTLVDYGFCYHRDPNFPADDMTWFLLEKREHEA